MARPERVAFGLSLASCSSELMNARMTLLQSSSPPESMASLSLTVIVIVTFIRFTAVSTCPVVILCQRPFLSVGWPALRVLFCCKHECLTIPVLSHSCCFSNAASAHGGSSTCLVLEHVALLAILLIQSGKERVTT